MEKRKVKLNILDIAIFVVILCAIAVLIFHDVIHDAFGVPEMSQITITVKPINASETVELNDDETVSVVLDDSTGVTTTAAFEEYNDGEITVVCNGYKKFGKYYTEHGELVKLGSACTLQGKDATVECEVEKVDINE